jgi:ribosome-associated heat shock protein Hsp15
MRLDKWLWAARFFKTRALAVDAVERHRVQVNGQACKPARDIRAGDRIRLQQPGWWREVLVQGLSPYRGPAPQAQLLYQDSAESLREAAAAAERRRLSPEPASSLVQGRPTKRDRRQIDALDQSPVDWDRWSASLPPQR